MPRRDQVQVIHAGNAMWRRLDLLAAVDGTPRSDAMMISGLGGGRKRLQRPIGELQPA